MAFGTATITNDVRVTKDPSETRDIIRLRPMENDAPSGCDILITSDAAALQLISDLAAIVRASHLGV